MKKTYRCLTDDRSELDKRKPISNRMIRHETGQQTDQQRWRTWNCPFKDQYSDNQRDSEQRQIRIGPTQMRNVREKIAKRKLSSQDRELLEDHQEGDAGHQSRQHRIGREFHDLRQPGGSEQDL